MKLHGYSVFGTALLFFSLLMSATVFGQGVTNIKINVPKKSSPNFPIQRLKVTVSMATDAHVAFNVTNPHGVTKRFPAVGTFSPGGPVVPNIEMCVSPCIPPPGTSGVDVVSAIPPPNLPALDPARKRYVFQIELLSDYDLNNFCAHPSGFPAMGEEWTIAVDTGPNIVGVCLGSFERTPSCNSMVTDFALIKSTNPSDVATVVGSSTPTACEERPAVDVVLVLDKSGSMGWSTMGGSPRPKIDALRDAVKRFVNQWTDLRSSETSPPDDQLGIVLFDTDAQWIGWGGLAAGLHPFTTIQPLVTDVNLNSIIPGGNTSIGDGLEKAVSEGLFKDMATEGNGHRKVILLMSNGMENTTQRVDVNDPMNPTIIRTFPTGAAEAAKVSLPHQSELQIYSVTVGTSTAVSADINEDIATATKGFYINTETQSDLLSIYFLDLLQNFLKFNTYETVRMISH